MPSGPSENNSSSDGEKNETKSRRRRGGGVGTEMPCLDDIQTTPQDAPPGVGQFRAMQFDQQGPDLLRSEFSVFKSAPVQVRRPQQVHETSPEINAAKTKEWAPLPSNAGVKPNEWNGDYTVIQDRPAYFPDNYIQHEFMAAQLDLVLSRICAFFLALSIQARLRENPLSAFLQTVENVELYLVFFYERVSSATADPSSRKILMSVQRHKGDQMTAHKYINQLVEAAKGSNVEEDQIEGGTLLSGGVPKRSMPRADQLLAVEKLVEKAVSDPEGPLKGMNLHPFGKQTPAEMTRSSMNQLQGWMSQPKRLDYRRHFLEYLRCMTDVKHTLSSSAITGSFIVLGGTAPDMVEEARKIQQYFLELLLNRALEGDEEMFEGMKPAKDQDEDVDMRPYFPDPEGSQLSDRFPQHMIVYFSELFHIALQVLVQSLEVIACFHEKVVEDGWDIEELASDLFARGAEVAPSNDLYTTLLDCVDQVDHKLANAALACKALRLLALANVAVKDRLKGDEKAQDSINKAFTVGQSCHAYLRDESFQLWETVRE